MHFARLSVFAVVVLSLISMETFAAPVNRKFHPVVNDDPQNAHLNVQTPGADINQTITITPQPGPDGQVIPSADTKIAACALKDANGDIDLSGGGSCWSPKAPAPITERQAVAASTIGRASSPSQQIASRTISVVRPASASVTQAANAPSYTPSRASHPVQVASVPTLLPVHSTETARAIALPEKRPTPVVRTAAVRNSAVRSNVHTGMRWFEAGLIALAAATLFAVGLALMVRMGLGNLLVIRRHTETGEEQDNRVPAVVRSTPRVP